MARCSYFQTSFSVFASYAASLPMLLAPGIGRNLRSALPPTLMLVGSTGSAVSSMHDWLSGTISRPVG